MSDTNSDVEEIPEELQNTDNDGNENADTHSPSGSDESVAGTSTGSEEQKYRKDKVSGYIIFLNNISVQSIFSGFCPFEKIILILIFKS